MHSRQLHLQMMAGVCFVNNRPFESPAVDIAIAAIKLLLIHFLWKGSDVKISLLNAGLRLPDYLTAPRDYFFLRPS